MEFKLYEIQVEYRKKGTPFFSSLRMMPLRLRSMGLSYLEFGSELIYLRSLPHPKVSFTQFENIFYTLGNKY